MRSRTSTQLSEWALRPFSSLKTTVFPAAPGDAICQKLQPTIFLCCQPKSCNTNMSCGRIAAKIEPCQPNSENFRHTVLSHIKFPLSHWPWYEHVRKTAAKHSRSSSEPAQLTPKMLFQVRSCSKANSHTTFLKCGNSNTSAKKGKKMFQHSCSYGLDGMYIYIYVCIFIYIYIRIILAYWRIYNSISILCSKKSGLFWGCTSQYPQFINQFPGPMASTIFAGVYTL